MRTQNSWASSIFGQVFLKIARNFLNIQFCLGSSSYEKRLRLLLTPMLRQRPKPKSKPRLGPWPQLGPKTRPRPKPRPRPRPMPKPNFSPSLSLSSPMSLPRPSLGLRLSLIFCLTSALTLTFTIKKPKGLKIVGVSKKESQKRLEVRGRSAQNI